MGQGDEEVEALSLSPQFHNIKQIWFFWKEMHKNEKIELLCLVIYEIKCWWLIYMVGKSTELLKFIKNRNSDKNNINKIW